LERETGFEPATSTLARLHSTAELFPPCGLEVFVKITSFDGTCQVPGAESNAFQAPDSFVKGGFEGDFAGIKHI
jgi:hypothetical protein